MILDALRSLRNPAPARRSDAISYLSSLKDPADWVYDWLGARRESHAGIHVSRRTALENASRWAGMEVISSSVAMIAWNVLRKLFKGGKWYREVALDDPRQDLIHRKPNPEMTAYNWRQKILFDLLSANNHVTRIEFDKRTGEVKALWPVQDPNSVRKVRKKGRLVYEWTHDGKTEPLEPEEVLHFYGLSDDGFVGINRINQAVESIGLSLAQLVAAGSFFGNGMELSGHFETPHVFDEIARERLRKDLDARHGGPGKRHGVDIFDEGLTFKQKSANMREAQYVDSRKFQAVEDARWLNVPPAMIHDHERSTYSNVEHQAIILVRHTLLPHIACIEQEIDGKIFLPSERRSLYVKGHVEGLLRGDSKAQAEFFKALFEIGVYSQNMILDLLDENPIEGGDRHYVPLNMVPIDRVDDAIADPEDEPEPDPDAGDEEGEASVRSAVPAREARSLKLRQRIRKAHRTLFRDAGQRVIRREVDRVRRAVKRHLGSRDVQDLLAALREIYAELEPAMLRAILPALRALAEQIQASIAEDFDAEADLSAEFEDFVRKVATGATGRHVGVQLGQLEKLIRDTDPEDLEARLLDRLDEWAERWPDKFARRETVQSGEAFARFAFVAAGVTQLRWAASGETCPFCEAMDGVVVGREAPFVTKGQTLTGDEEHADLTADGNVFHPPLHDGCDCSVVPG